MSKETKVTLPKLGESILNATIVQWFKEVGDEVAKDEPLLEVSTDKVNSEIPSPVSGILKKIEVAPDTECEVGDLLCIISDEKGSVAIAPKGAEEKESLPQEQTYETGMEEYYSPAVMRLAREKGIPFTELDKIQGTGAGGRITKKDIETYQTAKKAPCPLKIAEGEERVKMTGMRKAIADNMVRSFYEAPHASLITEVDVTKAMQLAKGERESFLEKHGVKLTITSFVARAIARALQEYPLLNASLDADTIVIKRYINLGIAVSVEQGIMVPVIRGIHRMSLPEIAKNVGLFAEKARTMSLSPDDVKEGTITMTNFGMSGVQIGIPIIRYPEVAIIGIGAITKKVVALGDETIGIRQMMHICLTFDHRVIDGMYGCGFLGAVKRHLETDP